MSDTPGVLAERSAVVIEDDPDIRILLRELLEQQGFSVREATTGRQGVDLVLGTEPDLVTLDVGLPDLDGVEVCRRIRDVSDAYVVMLTARSDEIDKLLGLEVGADDYLVKPFSPRELRARIAAIFRRPRRALPGTPHPSEAPVGAESAAGAGPSDAVTQHAGIGLDTEARMVTVVGEVRDLTRTEFDLLAVLMSNPRRAWSREVLTAEVWGENWTGDGHLVEVHMGNLRRKLGRRDDETWRITTVRGVGYRLTPA